MSLKSGFLRLSKAESGMAAAEFALIAPVLISLLLGAWDVSRIIQERMALGSILRAGVESAFREKTKEQIEATMRAASDIRIGASNMPYNVVPRADRTCACPPAVGASLALFSCVDRTSASYPCGATTPAYEVWTLSLEKTVDTVLLPERAFSVSTSVIIR